jgi:hypothetical protein
MHARSLIASVTVLALCACATEARPPEDEPSAEPAATALQSSDAASIKPVARAPVGVDEVSTDVDVSPLVCRKEAPTGTRLEQVICWRRTEASPTYGVW